MVEEECNLVEEEQPVPAKEKKKKKELTELDQQLKVL